MVTTPLMERPNAAQRASNTAVTERRCALAFALWQRVLVLVKCLVVQSRPLRSRRRQTFFPSGERSHEVLTLESLIGGRSDSRVHRLVGRS